MPPMGFGIIHYNERRQARVPAPNSSSDGQSCGSCPLPPTTVSENLGKSVHIDAKLLNRGNKKKQVDGEIALHVHIGAEELVRSEVLVGEDKLPTVNAVSMTYSLGMMLVFTMLFPISESKSV